MRVALVTQNDLKQEVQLSEAVFSVPFNEPLIHQVVTAYLAAGRQGTRAQKNRSEVRGGGKKPWKQKGMGRARAGSIRSPIWRGGGVTFAAKPRDFSQKVNKKMYRAALRSIISELLRKNRLLILDSLKIETSKTRDMVAKLEEFNLLNQRVFIVLEEVEQKIYLATRNLHKVCLADIEAINPVDLIKHDKIIITASALKKFEERLT